MTSIELLDECAEDVEEVLVAWLTPLRRTGVARQVGDPLPFTLVRHLTGAEDACNGLADPVASIHTLCDKALGWANAKNEGKLTDRRMGELERYPHLIILSDGRHANVDYVKCVESPTWQSFEDVQILRKVGRYQIGLTYVSIPG